MTSRLRISVAMATRNGARFVMQQLESIRAQTRPPDELMVSDDASDDGTPQLVRAFAATCPFPVRLLQNDAPLGSTKNFEQVITRCSGDVILLADQDDLWLPVKVERFASHLESQPDIGGMFSDAIIIDEAGREVAPSLWSHIGFTPAERAAWMNGRASEVLAVHNVVTGATLGFRASLRDRIVPFPQQRGLIHDRWIALIVAATSSLAAHDEPLVRYRQHAAQQVGAGEPAGGLARWVTLARETGPSEFATWADEFEIVRERLRQLGPEAAAARNLQALQERIDHLRIRSSLPPARLRRIRPVIRELMTARYHRYSNGFWSVAKDLLWK